MPAQPNNTMPYLNPLPGVPHIESPFFDALFADATPNIVQIARHMQQYGYAVIDFPDPELPSLITELQQQLTPRYDSSAWDQFRTGAHADLRLRDAWRYSAPVQRIAANPVIIELLSRLYGMRAWPFQTLNFPVGTEQNLHSDVVHFHSVPERFMCGVWLALEDITLENGPLFYYPGSHQWPIYTNEHIGRCMSTLPVRPDQTAFEPMWHALTEQHGAPKQTFLAKKGQALIWAANLLHGGSRQINRQQTRWSQVTHYFFGGCAWYSPLFSDPFYGQIHFRHMMNIQTGQIMQPSYAGNPVPEAFIAATKSTQPDGPYQFDGAAYLAANPDVAAAGVAALEHYVRHGHEERRRLGP
jgi:hypothetical protein